MARGVPARVGEYQVMTGPDLKAFNSFDAPKRVIPRPVEPPKAGARMTFSLPLILTPWLICQESDRSPRTPH